MQTMITDNNRSSFEWRVNAKLSKGWVVVPGTNTSGPLGFTIVLEKLEESTKLGWDRLG